MKAISVMFLVAVTIGAGACVSTQPPVVDAGLLSLRERPVVIFVSGLTGSVLYDKEADRVTWGDFRSFFLPHDYGYPTALPIGGAADRIEARDPIIEVRGGPLYRREIYRPVVTTLEANGFRNGVDLFMFGYDWRKSNVASARKLARLIDRIGADANRRIVLICQSNGGYLCRWATRFGDVGIEEVERGVVRPANTGVEKLILVGTANRGSIRILREIDRGRTYVKFGRFLSPETFFTFESLYQDLPPLRHDLFVDERGRSVDIELFDAKNWEKYGWAIFGNEAARRADERPDLFGDRERRLAFLQRELDLARRFHAALDNGPSPPPGIRYYSIQSRTHDTMYRAMLVRDRSRWRTLFLGDPEVDSRPELKNKMTMSGDGHACFESEEALTEEERARMALPVFEVDGDHLTVVTGEESHKALLTILRDGEKM